MLDSSAIVVELSLYKVFVLCFVMGLHGFLLGDYSWDCGAGLAGCLHFFLLKDLLKTGQYN